jgi:hypothetical protein
MVVIRGKQMALLGVYDVFAWTKRGILVVRLSYDYFSKIRLLFDIFST